MSNSMFILSACAHELYPTDVCFCILWGADEENLGLMPEHPLRGEWGISTSIGFRLQEEMNTPELIDVVWLSVVEQKTYSLEQVITPPKIQNAQNILSGYIESFLVGLAPFGAVALWAFNPSKSCIVGWYKGEEFEVSTSDFYNTETDISFAELCSMYIEGNIQAQNHLLLNGLPPRDLFDNYMKQFTYRYVIRYERWDDDDEKWQRYEEDEVQPEYDFIEEMLYDGTHDKLHDGGLLKYHEAGKPKKLALAWHIKKSEYTAYFWFEDERIREVFDRFYGAHPDTKTDFIIRIDPEKRKYELALYRYGLKEPYTIPEDAYQLIVFKNKFEDYRSENYNQPTGAWIW